MTIRTSTLLFTVLLAACGGTTSTTTTSSGQGGSAGQGGSDPAGSGGTGMATSAVTTGPGPITGPGSTGQGGWGGQGGDGAGGAGATGGSAGTGGSGGGGRDCGARAGATCSANEYCDFSDNLCGAADRPGTCRPRPNGDCPAIHLFSCGCDGQIYRTPCDAMMKGTDVSNLGGCKAPADTFACGSTFCGKVQQFCVAAANDVVGEPDFFSCPARPASCDAGSPSCACISLCGPLQKCMADADGDIFVSCPGG